MKRSYTSMSRFYISTRRGFHEHVETLSSEQRRFIDLLNDWFGDPRPLIVRVMGGPGVGKTHTVTETLKFVKDVRIVKMGFSACVAKRIGGRTIHSCMKLGWGPGTVLADVERKVSQVPINDSYIQTCLELSQKILPEFKECLLKPHILVIDEISAIDFWFTHRIFEYFWKQRGNMLVVVMGDPCQIGPVNSLYSLFEVDYPDVETLDIELTQSRRFVPEYDVIIQQIRLLLKDETNFHQYIWQKFPVVEDIDETILSRCKRVLAYKNISVDSYNEYYLDTQPGPFYRVYETDEEGGVNYEAYTDVRAGCLVNVTENGCGPVYNGTTLRFVRYDSNSDSVECTDFEGKSIMIRRSSFTRRIPITLAFANTISKCQGETIDEEGLLFNFDQSNNLRMIYTGLSRVRSMDQIVAVKL